MLAGAIKKRSPGANTKFRIEGEREGKEECSVRKIKKRSDVLFITTAPRVVSLVYNNRQFYFIFIFFKVNV